MWAVASLRKILQPGVSASILEFTSGLMEPPGCPGDCIPSGFSRIWVSGAGYPSTQAIMGRPT